MIKRIIAIFLLIMICLTLMVAPASAVTVASPDISAQSAILAERYTGEVIFSRNADIRHHTDSFNKVMTLLLAAYAIEHDIVSEHQLITMTESAWHDLDEYSSTLGIEPGEVMTFIDLIYSSYVGNANEASNMIALHLGGSIDGFARMMNDRAAEIGAVNTHFVNPHGQYHSAQHTTARDQLYIFTEALNSSLFYEVASTFRHVTEATYESEARTLTTTNALLNQGGRYHFRHSNAGRDSNSADGGRSLVAYAEEGDLSLVSVVIGTFDHIYADGAVDLRSFSETLRLFTWGFDNYSWTDVLRVTDLLARVPVLHGAGSDFVNARPETPLSILLSNDVETADFYRHYVFFYEIPLDQFDEYASISFNYNNEENPTLAAPVVARQVIGEVHLTLDDGRIEVIPLVANTSVNLSGIEYIRRQFIGLIWEEVETDVPRMPGEPVEYRFTPLARNTLLILGGVLLLYVGLTIRYHVVRANRRRRIKEAKNDIIRERHQGFRDHH